MIGSVCKQFFLCALDIFQKRFYNLISKIRETGVPNADHRGRHPPGNKLSDEKINLVKEHINSFPKFISHYTRKDNPNRKYTYRLTHSTYVFTGLIQTPAQPAIF